MLGSECIDKELNPCIEHEHSQLCLNWFIYMVRFVKVHTSMVYQHFFPLQHLC